MDSKIEVKQISAPADLSEAFFIRHEVFVEEQGCPASLEVEGNDISIHFLATIDGKPAAACRWRKTDKGVKLERFAVLKKYRGRGLGQEMVKTVLENLPANAPLIYLHSQVDAVSLYERFGFKKIGNEFMEAGIRHFTMEIPPSP
ncbi:GNAT family acetyltransferase [Mucilaginibacter sp. PAMC 26640]|nr:GNAT family acetyltransferase [Mucilaginibacter sp. PAMC 26640]